MNAVAEVDTAIETPDIEPQERRPPAGFLAQAGKGRPKGSINKLTLERQKFIEMVVGECDSVEREEFAASIRRQIMAGTCAPQIALFFLQHWLGVPKAKVELSGTVGVQKIIREIIDAPQLNAAPVQEVIDVTPTESTPEPGADGAN